MQKHKIWSFLLAILAAAMLWVYAVTVVNPDDQTGIRGVPVRITGTNELRMNGLMLTGGEFQTVDVEIAGRRSDLKELNNTTLEAVADAGKIDGPGTFELSWSLDPPSTVASGDIKLVSSSTNKIKVKVSEFLSRSDIPVEIQYEGALAEGFVRDPAVTNLQTVTVSGPAEEVERIRCARVVVELDDSRTSLDRELTYDLIDEEGEVMSLSSYVTVLEPVLRVRVPVYCYKQIELALEIVDGGGARAEHVRYTIDPPTLGVIGDESVLADIESGMVLRTVKLAEVKDSLTFTVTPELPNGVTVRGGETEIKVTVKLEGLATRTIYIPTEQILRENDGMALEFAVDRIPVTFRGKAEDIYRLSVDKLRVTADMTNDFDSNTMTVRLEVHIEAELDCGILGKVSAPVAEPTEETDPNETTGDR